MDINGYKCGNPCRQVRKLKKSALSTLSTSLTTLTGNTSLKVSSNGTPISASITDPSTAVAINSNISVSTLAKGQTLAFEEYASKKIR